MSEFFDQLKANKALLRNTVVMMLNCIFNTFNFYLIILGIANFGGNIFINFTVGAIFGMFAYFLQPLI